MDFQLQPYWLSRPVYPIDEDLRKAFDAVLDKALDNGTNAPIDFPLVTPKWLFLCYAAEQRGLALHGSANPDIRVFEPRQPQDLNDFGAQLAVYAASDGIWPMYFAIVDRTRCSTLTNACVRVEFPDGFMSQPYYLFSLDRRALRQHPYCNGYVYLLPRDTFVDEPPFPFGEVNVHSAQLASNVPVKPFARLAVSPEDFPFLSQMMAHEDERLQEYANAMISGLPWPEPSADEDGDRK